MEFSSALQSPLPGASDQVLAGKVALVTGAASGIGRASALQLAGHGASVALVDRDAHGCTSALSEIAGKGGKARSYPADLSNLDGIEPLVAAVSGQMGGIDILVNAAAMSDTSGILDGELDYWRASYSVNVFAPFLLMQHAAKDMIARGAGGRIVNLSSSSAFRTHAGAAYASSKGALGAMTTAAAGDLAPHGINVNAVAPGLTRTAMVMAALDDEAMQQAVSHGPLENLFHRPSEPEDIAATVLFLCLPASRQITAQVIHVSAGLVV